MIKKANKTALLLLASVTLFLGCSDDFLKEKKNYGSVTDEVYNDYEGAKGRIDYLYYRYLPKTENGDTFNDTRHTTGNPDLQSKSTEEYGGLSDFVNPDVILSNENVDEWFRGEDKITGVWGGIRNCNMTITGLEKSTLPDDQKEELLGQAYFFRAWAYYRLVKIYGGVPIVTVVQDPIVGDGDLSLVIPRSTTKECVDFICDDLRKAADYLPSKWRVPAKDYGRVTKGTALALMGRTRLLYASPLFNRADNKERWELAYQANKEAVEEVRYNLDKTGTNASEWAKLFATYAESPEAVFVTLYNNLSTKDISLNNQWDHNNRPGNIYGGGGRTPTAEMIDLFPMADGKRPRNLDSYTKLETSEYQYYPSLFFLNRDPRFYRTFAFPGVKWAAGGINIGDESSKNPEKYPYSLGENYELWSYAWQKEDVNSSNSGFYADGINDGGRKSIFIRKRSNDTQFSDPLYNFSTTDGFKRSAAPYMEIRYAEVLLNFAEAACGVERYAEAVEALREIRRRVGYTGDCGIEDLNDRGALFSAILYERQIELAYEGKRFDDMRRWLLWDGGARQEEIKASWKVTGFNGNTCIYLGVKPFNGAVRHQIEIRVKDKTAAEDYAADPIKSLRPAALDLMKNELVTSYDEDGNITYPDEAVAEMAEFYQDNLMRYQKSQDGDDTKKVTYKNYYYLIGFHRSVQSNNSRLEQTVGWHDIMTGSEGTFDPLAE